MRQSKKPIQDILIYTFVIFLISAVYFVYAYLLHPAIKEKGQDWIRHSLRHAWLAPFA